MDIRGNPNDATVYYERSLHYDKNNIYAIHNYSDFLLRENRNIDKANELIKYGLKVDNHNVLLLSLYAKVYILLYMYIYRCNIQIIMILLQLNSILKRL